MAPRPASPQVPGQLPPKRPPRLDVEGAVDRLVGDLHRLIVGVADPQPARDLLRGVVISEALLDHPAKLGTELEPRRRPPQRLISRLIVVWERRSARAIAREISSRSSKLRHLSGRRRAPGRMPPFSPGGCSRSPAEGPAGAQSRDRSPPRLAASRPRPLSPRSA